MAHDKVLIKCRVPADTHVFVKKRKAGIDINEAVVKALFKKHKKQFTVVQWHFPDKSSTKVPADTVTAEQLSSQDTEAELQPPVQLSSLQQDLDKAVKEAARASEHDMILEQMESDMQDRIVEVAVRVAGRLVKRNTPHDDLALLTALCKDNVKRGQLQHWLKDSNSCEEPEDYAAHFDRLYHKRCGEFCVSCMYGFILRAAVHVQPLPVWFCRKRTSQ